MRLFFYSGKIPGKIDKTGKALGQGGTTSFFFGSDPQALGNILANPNTRT
jgi:hypothetical protein